VNVRPDPTPSAPAWETAAPQPRVAPEALASFVARGTEVHIADETLGDLWLVPAYTDANRAELTPEHVAVVDLFLGLFPGSHIVEIRTPTSKK
jgi:hypothetical protein